MINEITYEQFKIALDEKQRLEKYLEYLTTITRTYMYQQETNRVKDRKADSDKYHREQTINQ